MMNKIQTPNLVGVCLSTFVLILCIFIVESVSEPAPSSSEQSSSFAMNSGGKGEVTASCNGKTYKGEGVAACTSAAYRFGTQDASFHLLILGLFIFIFRHSLGY